MHTEIAKRIQIDELARQATRKAGVLFGPAHEWITRHHDHDQAASWDTALHEAIHKHLAEQQNAICQVVDDVLNE